jgi:hypothetical protein
MAVKRMADRRTRQYQGEPWGGAVARWMNEPKHAESTERIAEIVALLQAAVDTGGKVNRDALRKLQQLLRCYEFRAVPNWMPREETSPEGSRNTLVHFFAMTGRNPEIEPDTDERGRLLVYYVTGQDRASREEGFAIWQLFELAQEGLQHRLCRCSWCKRWFFAHRHDQVFCSGKCRRSHREHSPEYRAAHREYMRRRYEPRTGKPNLRKQRRTNP